MASSLLACNRFLLLLLPLLALLLLSCLSSSSNGALGLENPVGEVNLNRNTAYNNALKCLQNQSINCPFGSALNESGRLMVNSTTRQQYCNKGCANQTIADLSCVSNVLVDFRFNNDATVSDIKTAIQTGCSTGNFTVHASPNGAIMMKAYWGSFWMLLTLFVALFPLTYTSV